MSGANELTRDDDIDVAGIFASLKRKWWLVLLVTLVVGALLVVILSLVSPRYESTSRILIRDNDNTFTRTIAETNSQQNRSQFDEQTMRSEAEVLQSDNLLREVLNEEIMNDGTKLYQLREFEGNNSFKDIRAKVLEATGQTAQLDTSELKPEVVKQIDRALGVFKERLDVYAVERSQVLVIEFWAHNPTLAQRVVKLLSERYVQKNLNAKIGGVSKAKELLGPEVDRLEQEVLDAEAAVVAYRAEQDLLQTENSNALLATQQLSQISGELSRLKTERSSAQSRAETIRRALKNGSSIDVIPEVIESSLVQRLREREVELRARISDLSTTLLPNHPRMRALESQLGDFQSQIRAEANNIVKSLENNVQATLQAEAGLEREIEGLKKNAAKLDEKLVELRKRERKADAARAQLQEYKSRSLEAETRLGLSQVDAEIISSATLADEAFFPKIIPFTIAGMVAALLLTLLAVIAGSLLSAVNVHHSRPVQRHDPEMDEAEVNQQHISDDQENAVESQERNHYKELESVLGRSRRFDPEKTTSSEVNDKPDEEISLEQDKVRKDTEGLKPHPVRMGAKVLSKISSATIPVVSPGGDIGSSTSWILARNLAKLNRSVVLVDMSGGEISSRKLLGKKGLPGLFNLLSGAVRADQILYKDRSSNVNVVPPGSIFSEGPAPDMEVLQEIIAAVAAPFDFCVIDCGDADVADVEMIAADDSIVVISCIKAKVTDVKELEEEFEDAGFPEVIRLAADKKDLAQEHRVKEAA